MIHRVFISQLNARHHNKGIILITGMAVIMTMFINIMQGEEFNNSTSYKELITKTYTANELLQLQSDIESDMKAYNLKKLNQQYLFECVRKVNVEYEGEKKECKYAVMLEDGGNLLYLFFAPDESVWRAAYYDYMPVEKDFNFIKIGKTTVPELEERGLKGYSLLSGRILYGYITGEGAVLVEARRRNGMEVVVDVRKYNTEYSEPMELKSLYSLILPILDIDKEEMMKTLTKE